MIRQGTRSWMHTTCLLYTSGKTQTILNIIANVVRSGKTVAVVSNNNSATHNVAEKLEKKNASFLTAFLGSLANKQKFLEMCIRDRTISAAPDKSPRWDRSKTAHG